MGRGMRMRERVRDRLHAPGAPAEPPVAPAPEPEQPAEEQPAG